MAWQTHQGMSRVFTLTASFLFLLLASARSSCPDLACGSVRRLDVRPFPGSDQEGEGKMTDHCSLPSRLPFVDRTIRERVAVPQSRLAWAGNAGNGTCWCISDAHATDGMHAPRASGTLSVARAINLLQASILFTSALLLVHDRWHA